MKRVSKKQANLIAEHGPKRKEWLLEHPVCAVCGGAATDVHEILAGAHRQNAFKEPCCWLRLCRICHDFVQGSSILYQLALKVLSDPSNFNLKKVMQIWGRTPQAITSGEILSEVCRLIENRINGGLGWNA